MEEIKKIEVTLGATAVGVIAVGEGQLIEMHRLVYGQWPPWNKAGGYTLGKRWATPAAALLEILGARRDSLFAARTLRMLVSDLRTRFFESTIHAARMRATMDLPDLGESQVRARSSSS